MANMSDQPRSSGPVDQLSRRSLLDHAVISHQGESLRFYSDLVRGRIVLVNFISTAEHKNNPVSENLLAVAHALGARLGDDVRMLSITSDPANDTPVVLRQFAERLEVPTGWLFIGGPKPSLDSLRASFFRKGNEFAETDELARREALTRFWAGFSDGTGNLICRQPPSSEDCSAGLIRYGNDAIGLWG